MDVDQLQSLLAGMRFTEAMSPATLRQLAEVCSLEHFDVGAYLFREGSRNDRLYLVRTGNVTINISIPGRGSQQILTIGPGDFVGWSSLLGEGKMTASAVAAECTDVLTAKAADMNALTERDFEFGFQLMRATAQALSRRLVATRLQMLDLFGKSESEPVESVRDA